MSSVDHETYRVRPGERVRLAERQTKVDGGLDKKETKEETLPALHRRLTELHDRLYAERRRAVLVILQAMDAAGKDSTIRRCFGVLNPQRCRTVPFKKPTTRERRYDFLWRVHHEVPATGILTVFNRSHYEDVTTARVRRVVPESLWQKRFAHINGFEKLLHDEGTLVLKFYLHISKDYQRERLERRLRRPDKRWKFDPSDLDARSRWDDYMAAYEDALERCSSAQAPWYVVPSERRWFRDLVITQAVVAHLEALDPQLPQPDFDPDAICVDP